MQNLEKGMNIPLKDAQGATLTKVRFGCGWDQKGGNAVDVDLSIALLTGKYEEGGKFINDDALIFYNRQSGPGVQHSGDNRTGAGDGDDEFVTIDTELLPTNCMSICAVVNIYSGAGNFGQISNVTANVYGDAAGTTKLANSSLDLTEDFSQFNAIVVGEYYKHNGEWKYKALNIGETTDLKGLINRWE